MGRGAYNQAVVPVITRPLHAQAHSDTSRFSLRHAITTVNSAAFLFSLLFARMKGCSGLAETSMSYVSIWQQLSKQFYYG